MDRNQRSETGGVVTVRTLRQEGAERPGLFAELEPSGTGFRGLDALTLERSTAPTGFRATYQFGRKARRQGDQMGFRSTAGKRNLQGQLPQVRALVDS